MLAAAGALVLLAAPAAAAASRPRFEIRPLEPVVLGDPIRVRLVGLAPGARVRVEAETVFGERLWRSWGEFTADADGVVDPAVQGPAAGTWEGVDPLGLYWSMEQTADEAEVPPADAPVVAMTFRARSGRVLLAERARRIWLQKPGVLAEEVNGADLVATFYRPGGSGPSPGIILVGGSAGGIGWQRATARRLASHGYAALALAYFGTEGLPKNLEEIPVETVERAVDWIAARPAVDGSRLAILGVSKGGELALLAASLLREIRAVVAWVPGSAVFQSIAPNWPVTSSWSWRGEPLPFVPYRTSGTFQDSGLLVDLYRESLEDREALARAVIPVERIRGPVLLFSGRADTLWPATLMAEQVVERLRRFRHSWPVDHRAYEDAGHLITRPPLSPAAGTTRWGGTPKGNAHATVDSWRRTLEFLGWALAAPAASGVSPAGCGSP